MIERNDQGGEMKRYAPPSKFGEFGPPMVESQNGNYYLVEEVDALNTPRPIDTAPKDGTEFLALGTDEIWDHVHINYGGFVCEKNGLYDWDISEYTHWLPLPPEVK